MPVPDGGLSLANTSVASAFLELPMMTMLLDTQNLHAGWLTHALSLLWHEAAGW